MLVNASKRCTIISYLQYASTRRLFTPVVVNPIRSKCKSKSNISSVLSEEREWSAQQCQLLTTNVLWGGEVKLCQFLFDLIGWFMLELADDWLNLLTIHVGIVRDV